MGIRSVSCSNPARYKNGYGVTFFCPLTILPVRRLPSRRSAGAGDAENNKRGRGGRRGRRSSDPSALSPLLSSGVVAAVLQFLLLSIVLPQIQFVVCDSRRDFTGDPCAYKKKPGAICCKIGSYFVLSVSIYCCCCCWLGGVLILLLLLLLGLFCGHSMCIYTFLHSRDFTSLVSLVCSFFQD